MARTQLLTSESVSAGHPDKMADQISDSVLDAILAQDRNARVACETLVKTALAPMFAGRALRVLSWEGYNMLGNRDGFVLNDPDARESKTQSKDRAVKQILGDEDRPFWKDHKGAKLNAIRTRSLLRPGDSLFNYYTFELTAQVKYWD